MQWRPHPGAQQEFCKRSEYEVLYGGAAGPGKTECLIMLATRHIDKPGYRGILFRRTYPRLTEILDRTWKYYPQMGGNWRATEKRWYFPGGDATRANKPFIQLGHMQHEDDKRDFQGKEYHFAGFDELTEFTEDQYLWIAASRIRTVDANIPGRVRCTTNPGGIGHAWVKRRFIDVARSSSAYVDPMTGLSRCFIPGRVSDNPSIVENDPGYVKRLLLLPETDRKRLLDGDWSVFDGQFFRGLSQSVHGIEPFEIPDEWEKFCVLDWGYGKPFSVGWYAVDYDGVLYRYREWYGCEDGKDDVGVRMVAADVARGIKEREHERVRFRIADPSIYNVTKGMQLRRGETLGPSVAEDMSTQGLAWIRADNDRLQGWQQVHRRLQQEESVDDETGEIVSHGARFYCFNDCRHFWRTMPLLQSSPKDVDDVDTDQEDHIADEFRYACMFRMVRPKMRQQTPAGTFAAERRRLMKARDYARRHGVSMHSAYQRVR